MMRYGVTVHSVHSLDRLKQKRHGVHSLRLVAWPWPIAPSATGKDMRIDHCYRPLPGEFVPRSEHLLGDTPPFYWAGQNCLIAGSWISRKWNLLYSLHLQIIPYHKQSYHNVPWFRMVFPWVLMIFPWFSHDYPLHKFNDHRWRWGSPPPSSWRRH